MKVMCKARMVKMSLKTRKVDYKKALGTWEEAYQVQFSIVEDENEEAQGEEESDDVLIERHFSYPTSRAGKEGAHSLSPSKLAAYQM
ncbi:hypothetical protein NDU88_003996 [Pleurodeles waltl]|uniref:Uncharacterized protein n=1 Tax=Pleurodeles waltl TaxID=8319 RepID=A0AAV7VJE8_PLEWA|nr:hypothetical protein NDU88_003996 [Pleurodeles waltl]